MKRLTRTLVKRSEQAFTLAIEVFNKPTIELDESGGIRLQEPNVLGNLTPAERVPDSLPPVAAVPEVSGWLHEQTLKVFIDEVRGERLGEIDRIAEHVELSLTELLQKADEEIGRAASDQGPGAEGRLAQAEARHAELQARRERRREDFGRQRALSLQAVERIASVLILPHPERSAPEVRRLQPNPETEATAMRVAMDHERAQGRQVYDVHEKNLGYDLTSLDLASGQLRLIEVKGLGGAAGSILLTPNERRVAEDRRDCHWLYVVTSCSSTPRLEVNALTEPMQVREPEPPPYDGSTDG